MKCLKVCFLAVLPVLAGCGDGSPPANPKVAGQAKAVKAVNQPAAESVGPVDKHGRPRSLVTQN